MDMDNYTDIFRSYLKENRLKFTPKRKAILDCVFSLNKHFDVDEIYENLRRNNKKVSRASIYRTMLLLVKSNLVKGTVCSTKMGNYEHVFGHAHHDHMMCIRCGKVIEFTNDEIEKLQDDVCEKYGFQPIEHKLVIRGYCRSCRGDK